MDNWMTCIDKALDKSNLAIEAIDYVAILHIKRSMHEFMLTELGKTSDQSIYLEDYGHIGQVDQILSLKLALDENRIKAGSKILMIAAGIGYVWAANVIAWGK
jgi:3-oxoacyl-[acyl-carrier-protein] synthase-3